MDQAGLKKVVGGFVLLRYDGGYMGKKNRGYITVEASIVVPIFLFFMLGMAEICMILMAEAHIHQALAAATDYVAQHCYLEQKILKGTKDVPDKKRDECVIDIGNLVDIAIVKKQFATYLGDDFYVERMVSGGSNGIILTVKRDNSNSKIMQIAARYQAKVILPLLGSYSINLSNQIKQKAFVGFSEEEYNNKDCYVYVTPNREAYHTRRDCTHLKLDVRSVLVDLQHTYMPCYYCGQGKKEDRLYVAKNGEVYHTTKDCVGLKRTVRRVKRTSVEGIGACERCCG